MALHRWRRLAWIPLGALAAGLLVAASPWQAALSRPLGDALLRGLPAAQPLAGVQVVDLADAALAALGPQLGRWPFQRDADAMVVDHLREIGARVIVINLLFIGPRTGDAALARSLARPGAPVVLAAAGLQRSIEARPAVPAPPADGGAHRLPRAALAGHRAAGRVDLARARPAAAQRHRHHPAGRRRHAVQPAAVA